MVEVGNTVVEGQVPLPLQGPPHLQRRGREIGAQGALLEGLKGPGHLPSAEVGVQVPQIGLKGILTTDLHPQGTEGNLIGNHHHHQGTPGNLQGTLGSQGIEMKWLPNGDKYPTRKSEIHHRKMA